MEMPKNAGALAGSARCSRVVQAHQNSRLYFSILGLMLSMIATRADDLPVINDSEAFQYVGKAVEVRKNTTPSFASGF
jgi:hypothetical protein